MFCVFSEKLGCDRLQIVWLPPRNFVLACKTFESFICELKVFPENEFCKRMQSFSGNRNDITILLCSLIKHLCSPEKLAFKQKNCGTKALKYIFSNLRFFPSLRLAFCFGWVYVSGAVVLIQNVDKYECVNSHTLHACVPCPRFWTCPLSRAQLTSLKVTSTHAIVPLVFLQSIYWHTFALTQIWALK